VFWQEHAAAIELRVSPPISEARFNVHRDVFRKGAAHGWSLCAALVSTPDGRDGI